ncbi:MAG: zf-TFIIB domain-containing protein [Holophaga sp.]|nr:zf-TFIIB domain-containing protein [Holophaga sp.]
MEAVAFRCPSCGAALGEDDIQCAYCHSQVATVACPNCFGLVSLRAKHCSHCGSAIESLPESPSSHGCPECRIPLVTQKVGSLQLDQCHRCGGLWLDLKLFEEIAADRETQGEVLGALPGEGPKGQVFETTVRYRPCPACGKFMNRSNYARISGVVLDTCKEHGIWFDRDELRRVLAFIEVGGLDKARNRQIQELEDKKRLAAMAPTQPGADWSEVDRHQGPGLLDLLGAVEGLIRRIRR